MKRSILIVVILIVVSAACYPFLAAKLERLIKDQRVQLFGDLVYRVETSEKVVALTFDDGPSPGNTEAILDFLERESITATFYLNGNKLQAHPQQAKRLVESGHELGNHTYTHSRMVAMSYSRVAQEVEDTTTALRAAGYEGTIRFRPPYGKAFFMLPLYLSNHNITTVTWDVEPEWFVEEKDTPELISQRTLEAVQPGSIVLLHVMYGNGATMQALPSIVAGLRQRGYRFVTVEQLLALEES